MLSLNNKQNYKQKITYSRFQINLILPQIFGTGFFTKIILQHSVKNYPKFQLQNINTITLPHTQNNKYMKFENIIGNIFKQDRLTRAIRQTTILQNTLRAPFLKQALKLYHDNLRRNLQQEMIKNLLRFIEQKGYNQKKLKIMTLWIEMFKQTKYDLSDILINKKVKLFTKTSSRKENSLQLTKSNFDQYLQSEILIPLYNYFMKLSINQDLYKHCLIGKIPDDEVFRRGSKIRFIWIFKIYNLIYLLIPILEACVTALDKYPDYIALLEISHVFYNDILTMNSFVIEALEEGSQDNFMLMPYFDMLQFYESLTQQKQIIVKINSIYSGLLSHQSMKPNKPRMLILDSETEAEIETQAVRVKLISCTLKNPKKDHSRLVTQYEEELVKQKSRLLKTEGGADLDRKSFNTMEDFTIKYKFLDE